MKPAVLLDTGPLVAFLSAADAQHDWAQQRWRDIQPPMLSCEAVIAEAVFLLQRERKSPQPVLGLVERGVIRVEFSLTEELRAITALIERYRDVPMSLADASLVRMSELWADSRVFTLDDDFRFYRRHGRQTIPLITPQ